MSTPAPSLSNLQVELLKLYATNISDDELLEIKRYLAKFFMKKAIAEADKTWDEKGYTDKLMQQWIEA